MQIVGLGQTLRYHAQMVYRVCQMLAPFSQTDQILSHHGDVHTIAMALHTQSAAVKTQQS